MYHFPTHQEVGLGCGLPEMLLDVLGLVGDHADERVQLNDYHTQVNEIHRVSQQGAQAWNKVCRERVGIFMLHVTTSDGCH